MNRAQRRSYNKAHKTSFTKAEFDMGLALARIKNGDVTYDDLAKLRGAAHMDNELIAPSGCSVKIDYENIFSRPVDMLTDEFKNWVEENKDKEFHLTREDSRDSLVCLEEDERYVEENGEKIRVPRWLFDLYSDLLIKVGDDWKHAYEIDEGEVSGYTDITPALSIATAVAQRVEEDKAAEEVENTEKIDEK